jgi:hypothetical protein
MGSFGTMGPTSGTAGSSGAGQNPNNSILLTLLIDAQKGIATIKQVGTSLAGLVGSLSGLGGAASSALGGLLGSSAAWTKLYAQTEMMAKGLHLLKGAFEDIIKDSTLYAARTEVLNTVLGVTARNMNYTTAMAQAQVKAIQGMNITHQNAIDITTQLMRAQIDLSQATALARAAQDLAVVSGENSSDTLQHLTIAIQEQNTMMLRQYGIVVNINTVMERYAATLNKSAAALTTQERSQAMVNTIMREGQKVTGSYVLSMEDAGKMMTSLDRLFKEAKETIGNAFLPVFTDLIKLTMSLLEAFISLDPLVIKVFGAFASGIIVIAGLSSVVFLLAKAWDAVKVAALGAMQAEAIAGLGLVAVATAIGPILIAITAIGIAIAAAVGYWAIFGEKAKQTEKNLKEQAEAVAVQAQSMDNLVKDYADLAVEEQKLLDIKAKKADVTERELHLNQLLTEEQNRQQAISHRETDLKARHFNLDQQAAKLAPQAVTYVNNVADGTERTVVSQQRLAELQKESHANLAKQIKVQEDHVNALKKQEQSYKTQQEQLKQQSATWDKMSATQKVMGITAWESVNITKENAAAAEKIEQKWKDTNAELVQANATLDEMKAKASGKQVVPIDIPGMVKGLQQGFAYTTQIIEAQRRGVQISQQQVQLVHDEIAGTVNIQNMRNTIAAKHEQNLAAAKGDKDIIDKENIAYNAIEKSVNGVGKELDGVNAKNKDNISLLTQTQKVMQKSLDTMQGIHAYTGVETQSFLEAQAAVTGFSRVQADWNRQESDAQRNNRIQTLELQRQQLQNFDQTLDKLQQQSDIETKIAEKRKTGLIEAAVLAGIGGQQLANYKSELQYEDDLSTKNRERNILLEQNVKLRGYELSLLQAQMAAYGETAERQIQLLDMEESEEIRVMRRILTEKYGSEVAAAIIHETFLAKRFAAFQAEIDKEKNYELEEIRARMATLQANVDIRTGHMNENQITAMKHLYDEEARMEIADLTRKVANSDYWKGKEVQAAEYIATKTTEINAQADQKKRDLDEARRRQEMADDVERMRVRQTLFGASAEAVNMAVKEAELRNQINELARRLLLTDKERDRYLQIEIDHLKRQQEIQKENLKISTAQQAIDSGVMGAEGMTVAVKELSAAEQEARENYQHVLEEFESGNATFQELTAAAEALSKAVGNLNQNFSNLVMSLASGVYNKLLLLKTAFQALGQAATASLQALIQGGNVGAALKQMQAALMNAVKEKVMVKVGEEAAEAASCAAALDFAGMGRHLLAMGEWVALGALVGAAAGGKGGGGGGGGGTPQLGSGGPQPLKPVETRTEMTDQIIKLNQNLEMQGRVLQYAGEQYSNLGATIFTMEHDINMMAVSNRQGWQDASSDLITHIDNSVKNGFQNFQDISTGIQNYMKDYQNTLPQVLSGNLADAMKGVSLTQSQDNQTLIDLGKRQLDELVKANAKDYSPTVNTVVSIDGAGFQSAVEGELIHSASTIPGQRAIASAAASAIGSNLSRQQLGTRLSPGGGV